MTDPHADYIDSTQRNQLESPLLKLPGEVRNKIYNYVFSVGSVHFGRSHHHYRTSETDYVPEGCDPTDLLDVTSTCRQIRSDTSTLLFKNNVIIIDDQKLSKMVDQLEPHQLEAIKALEIIFYDLKGWIPNWTTISRQFAREFKHMLALERISIRLICWLQDDDVLEYQCEEFCEAIRKNTRRKPIEVTNALKHEGDDEGETDVDEEETTSDEETTPDGEAEPEDEGLVAMTMSLHL
ncbi:hypothetical protein J4E93_004614 [Alternaria ventricosa]|uniref:uncharacterized protein n=1 Tax=Alternaria ventricosa TaxID=1187951 RepID=UPI0020C3E050|nr:uncharacterized protein J4E93_004614 [Alternaria ventricosa]KAI4648202.1 hypothetical protein J4E93_004614 [Alternaria ventricosa]